MACVPPRMRCRFKDGKCSGCGRQREVVLSVSEATVDLPAGLSIDETKLKKPERFPPPAAKLKLETLTQLAESYLEARSNLKKFLNQHVGFKVDDEDHLFVATSTMLDSLYKDLGRETFWKGMR